MELGKGDDARAVPVEGVEDTVALLFGQREAQLADEAEELAPVDGAGLVRVKLVELDLQIKCLKPAEELVKGDGAGAVAVEQAEGVAELFWTQLDPQLTRNEAKLVGVDGAAAVLVVLLKDGLE